MVPYRERPAAALLFAMRRAAFTVRTNIRPPAVATTSHLTACRAPTRAATAACTRRTPGCLCTRATLAAASWPPRRAASRRRCGRGPRPARSLSRPASVPPRGQTSTHCLACETAANASLRLLPPVVLSTNRFRSRPGPFCVALCIRRYRGMCFSIAALCKRAMLRQGWQGCRRLVVRREGLTCFYCRPRARVATSLAATWSEGLREIGGQA